VNKYLAILDHRTAALLLCCALVTWLCLRFGFSYNLNVTLFSIAVVFPLVFTIREAFKRRDAALKFLGQFKSGLISVHYAFEQLRKLPREKKDFVAGELQETAELFLATLRSQSMDNSAADQRLHGLIQFIRAHRSELSTSAIMKIIRFLQDVHESMENTLSIKRHGTPVSLRAYCLVFVFLFPIVFIPTIVHHLDTSPLWLIYFMSLLHGFILISLYNVQVDMENPFDQIGLDDIQLDEFRFLRMAPDADWALDTAPAAQLTTSTDGDGNDSSAAR
jgi:hypothetical protein